MRGITRNAVLLISRSDGGGFLFLHLLNPDVHNLLQLARSEVAQRRVPSVLLREYLRVLRIRSFDDLALELEALSKLLREARKLVHLRKGAEDNKDLLPFSEISVLDDVVEVVGDDGLVEPEIR